MNRNDLADESFWSMSIEPSATEVDVSGAGNSTRWNHYRRSAKPAGQPPVEDSAERGGLYLAAFSALLLPVLIVGVLILSTTDGNTDLEQADIVPSSTTPSPAPSTAAPAGGELPDADQPAVNPIAPSVAGTTELADPIREDDEFEPNLDETTPAVSAASASPAPVADDGDDPAAAESLDPAVVPAPIPVTTRTTQPNAATIAPTTAPPRALPSPVASTPVTAAPTTVVTTTTRPPTTTTATTTTAPTPTEPPTPGPALAVSQRIDIGQLGDTFVRIRFGTNSTTSYRVVVLGRGQVVASRTGTAVANQTVGVSVEGLTPGTDYNVQVILDGPPPVTSAPVAFRTSGGDPAPVEQAVQLLNLRVVETQSNRVELNYESNVCANGSFVIRKTNGDFVGSNGGQSSGCTTRHLAIPGFWTPALEPDTAYEITLRVEAGGAGLGNGNVDTETISIRTSP